MLLADRGYDADWIRALAAERGVCANIPPKFFNKIKQCRRVATRYEARGEPTSLHPTRFD
jgi:transposase